MAYLFLEITVLAFFLGFCWDYLQAGQLVSRRFWVPAAGLAVLWFAIDQIAIRLGLWSFPPGGTIDWRLAGLPVEEYILFFLHTFICFALLRLHRPNL